MRIGLALSAVAVVAVSTSVQAQSARDYISIVGSSTVYPFSTVVAEQFGKTTDFKTPKVESTGSGGGLKLFCSGVGEQFPDITNASRRMKAKEFKTCAANGVTAITENVIGFDGIVIANAKDAPAFSLTRAQLAIALAENGPKPVKWSDVDPSLPATKIEVMGPPPSSGTRDAFEELVMDEGCKDTALVECKGISIRQDGAYIESGENDNLIVSKLEANHNALGIFGYSYLEQNADKLKGANVDGVEPTFENIADAQYPVSRSLYFYIKDAHVGVVPGIQEYANLFMSDAMTGDEGALVDKGLIPLPMDKHKQYQHDTANLVEMDGKGLH